MGITLRIGPYVAVVMMVVGGCHLVLDLRDIEVEQAGSGGQGGGGFGGEGPGSGGAGGGGKLTGDKCGNDNECQTGFCTDGVCCASRCDGECVSCNNTAELGSCTAYPVATDPEDECGGYTCSQDGCYDECMAAGKECKAGKFCNAAECDWATQIACGEQHTCVRLHSGFLRCWGDNSRGQLGTGTSGPGAKSPVPLPVAVVGQDTAAVSTGKSHSCAVYTSGQVACWGWNSAGQLGNGNNSDSATPLIINDILINSTEVLRAGDRHTCALSVGGNVACWGENTFGQLGDGSKIDHATPTPSAAVSAFDFITAGARHNCGITALGSVLCWGDNAKGQLGVDPTTTMNSAVPLITLPAVGPAPVSVEAGNAHTCALFANNTIQCWGANGKGQLGDGTIVSNYMPQKVPGKDWGTGAVLTLGDGHTCAIDGNGKAKCWGDNDAGQLGTGVATDSSAPVLVKGDDSYQAISAGAFHTCGLLTNGAVKCWGSNSVGQLGTGNFKSSTSPVDVVF